MFYLLNVGVEGGAITALNLIALGLWPLVNGVSAVVHWDLAQVVRVHLARVHRVRGEVLGGILLGEKPKLLQLGRIWHRQLRQVEKRFFVAPDQLLGSFRDPASISQARHDGIECILEIENGLIKIKWFNCQRLKYCMIYCKLKFDILILVKWDEMFYLIKVSRFSHLVKCRDCRNVSGGDDVGFLISGTQFRNKFEFFSGLITHRTVPVPRHILFDPFLTGKKH